MKNGFEKAFVRIRGNKGKKSGMNTAFVQDYADVEVAARQQPTVAGYARKPVGKHSGDCLTCSIARQFDPIFETVKTQPANDAKLAKIENVLKNTRHGRIKFFNILVHQDLVMAQNKNVFEKYQCIHKGRDVVLRADDSGFVTDYNGIRNRINDHKNKTDAKKPFEIMLSSDVLSLSSSTIGRISPPSVTEENSAKSFYMSYPDMEIISVNPVGLKGLFRDVYTESYLNDHPEIDRKTVEILKEED